MSNIDVSVITPTFRREKLVLEAIVSALTQQGVTVEMIVLDDSPEASARAPIQETFGDRVQYVARERPTGGVPAIVRNEGLAMARGRYVHFLDDDDRLVPGALAALVSALDAAPTKGVAFGDVTPFGRDGGVLEQQRRYFATASRAARRRRTHLDMTASLLFKDTVLVNSACMARRSCAVALGGYDATIPRCEDVDFYMRAVRAFGYVHVKRPVLEYRTSEPSLMHDMKDGRLLVESYRRIHAKYRATHGAVEFYGLKAFARLL